MANTTSVTASSSSLKGVAVIEKDVNNDLFSWSFPNLPREEVIRLHCGLNDKDMQPTFRFARTRDTWHYLQTAVVPPDNKKSGNKDVTSVCLVVLSSAFNPEKYQALSKLLAKIYLESRSTLSVMQAFLSAMMNGSIKSKLGEFDDAAFPDKRAILSPVKPIFELFGTEAIVIWTAVLLKKRIFVYSPDKAQLLAVVRSMPLLGGFHRRSWSLLRPLFTFSPTEIADLNATGVYIAGCCDPSAAQHKELYDLFVDIPGRSFSIPDHAKEALKMTKFHKSAAEALVKVAASGSDTDLIKAIDAKTKELLAKIRSLGSDLSLEKLNGMNLPPNMASFLYHVATAEGNASQAPE